jgi:CRISPR-associated protein Csb2
MTLALTFSIRMLDGRHHGRTDDGLQPEWPPSPMRLFQALLASAAPRWVDSDTRDRERPAFLWLEQQPAPEIITPFSQKGNPRLTYVPNNNDPGKNERTGKIIQPTLLGHDRLIEFRYTFDPAQPEATAHAETLTTIARHIQAFGWGIDLAIGHATIGEPATVPPHRFHNLPAELFTGGETKRTPTPGTLESLERAHQAKLDRFSVPGTLTLQNIPLTFAEVTYGTSTPRAFAAFKFVDEDDDPVAYPIAAIKEIAGRLRNLAARLAKSAFDESATNGMILGHPQDNPRLSILPLPSIGHPHSDGRIRRVLLLEPAGPSLPLAAHLRKALDQQLFDFDGDCPFPASRLVALPRSDSVTNRFVGNSQTWASVTPVLLPGHNQRRNDDAVKSLARAQALVAKSLQQAGITAEAEFEINRIPYWRGTHHVRDYHPREKLQHCPRFHVLLKFKHCFTGPLAIGAGRHVGFGTFAAMDGSFSQE